MTSFFNFTLQSNSPVFSYGESGWSQFSSTGQESTSHITQSDQASFQLSFQGSSIELFGSANCSYSITLDGSPFSGLVPLDGQLFNASNLSPDETHTLVLQASISEPSTSLIFEKAVVFIPATNVAIQTVPTPTLLYSPQWSSNSTTHLTTTLGEFAEWNFTGINAVEIRGSLGSEHGVYEISLDNIVTTYNASSPSFIPSSTKFFASGLNENGTHTLRISNAQNDSALTVSEFIAYDIRSSPLADQEAPSTTPQSSSSSNIFDEHKLVAIIAPVVIVALSIVLGAFYFILRRRRQRHLAHDTTVVPFQNFRTSMSLTSSIGEHKKGMFGDWESQLGFKKGRKTSTKKEVSAPSAPPPKRVIGLPQNPRAWLPPKSPVPPV